jgi:hypothetical protein
MSKLKESWGKIPRWIRIVLYVILGAAGAAALGLLFGHLIRWLWNWLMPYLFGLPAIGFWQGLGIFVLARLLLGGFGGSDGERSKSGRKCRKKSEDEDCETWEYYDDWWESDGEKAFRAYAEGRKEAPETDGTE